MMMIHSHPLTPPLPEIIAEFDVTFNGYECTVSDMSESTPGRHSFILNDLSDKEIDLWVGRLLEGKTVQDLINNNGGQGEWTPKPSWFFYTDQIGTEVINEDGKEVWKYMLDIEGEYVIYVGIYLEDTKNLWFCVQTLIIESPSK